MTATDITALVEKLRDPKPLPWKYVEQAADALEALLTERDAALFDKAVAGGKVRVAEARAEKAEAALLDTQERLRIQRDLTDTVAAQLAILETKRPAIAANIRDLAGDKP